MKYLKTQLMLIIILLQLFSSFKNIEYSNNTSHLFKIERSLDANEIMYDINITPSNKLNTSEPLSIYWLKHSDQNKIEPLTWIQKSYAYGVEFISKDENELVFEFVSYRKRSFSLKKDTNGNFRVFTNSNGKEVMLNRIFIQIDGGSFWLPKVTRVEIHSQDSKTKENIIEIINP